MKNDNKNTDTIDLKQFGYEGIVAEVEKGHVMTQEEADKAAEFIKSIKQKEGRTE